MRCWVAAVLACCAVRCAGAFLFAGSREVKRLREQLTQASAQLDAQAQHIEALYTMLGHTVSVVPPSGRAGGAGGAQVSGGARAHSPSAAPGGPSAVPGGSSFAAEILERERTRSLEKLTLKWTVDVGVRVCSVSFMTLFSEGALPRVLFAGDENGTLHGFSRSGARLVSYATEHADAITALAFGSREEPFVATASADGNVIVHNISISRDRGARPPKARAPRQPGAAEGADAPLAGPPPPPPPPALSLRLDRVIPLQPDGDLRFASPAVTALEVYSRGRRSVLLAGDSQGVWRMLQRNGTLVRTLKVGQGGGVSASARLGTVLAYGTSDGALGLIDLHRFAPLRACELPAAADAAAAGSAPAPAPAVVSLAFDPQLSQLLYAGTADGLTHAFNTRARRRDPAAEAVLQRGTPRQKQAATQTVTVCQRVSSWSTHAPAASGVALGASKGFVFGASAPAPAPAGRRGAPAPSAPEPGVFSVTNVSALYGHTKGSPRALLTLPLHAQPALAHAGAHGGGERARVLLAVGARTLAVAGGGNATELRLYEHRFEYVEPRDGFNMRGPMVVLALVITVGWQVWKKWSNDRSAGDGGARGVGGGLANRRAADLAALDREMEQLRSLGGEGLLGDADGGPGGGRAALRGAGSSRRAGGGGLASSSSSAYGRGADARGMGRGAGGGRLSEATRRAKFNEIFDDDDDGDDGYD